ncbi:ESX secretion-associated protein EspG [Saccharothrix coeruleofusca]|uniref:ESAT-6 protein secretion system EspG family protein n=1 Tax=Saccharothrix coeruleofusca TaxID=33919 RepID=A0A918AT93_9PSEU|nr:ESX secretion-associated protein EspG [Saccharothrix coeruleofusca]GGP80660.1 hypothetical protein GCM10010185_63180 [Saccharothrix coeruleofusca]
MTTATFRAAAFRAVWQHLDLGAMPLVLHVEDAPAPWDELVRGGLARGGEVDPWLVGACKLLATPPRSADLRLGIGSSAVRALAASAGSGVVLAVLRGDAVTVRELPRADVPSALVGLLPREGDRVGAAELRGRFGAAVLDASGRRRRAQDVVDFHGLVGADVLRARLAALLDGLSG